MTKVYRNIFGRNFCLLWGLVRYFSMYFLQCTPSDILLGTHTHTHTHKLSTHYKPNWKYFPFSNKTCTDQTLPHWPSSFRKKTLFFTLHSRYAGQSLLLVVCVCPVECACSDAVKDGKKHDT